MTTQPPRPQRRLERSLVLLVPAVLFGLLVTLQWRTQLERSELSVRYNANRFNGVNFEFTGANSSQQHTGNSDVTTDNVAVNYTKVFGASTIFESRFNVGRDNEPGAANSTDPPVSPLPRAASVTNRPFNPNVGLLPQYALVNWSPLAMLTGIIV